MHELVYVLLRIGVQLVLLRVPRHHHKRGYALLLLLIAEQFPELSQLIAVHPLRHLVEQGRLKRFGVV